jgi:hypothetical protein
VGEFIPLDNRLLPGLSASEIERAILTNFTVSPLASVSVTTRSTSKILTDLANLIAPLVVPDAWTPAPDGGFSASRPRPGNAAFDNALYAPVDFTRFCYDVASADLAGGTVCWLSGPNSFGYMANGGAGGTNFSDTFNSVGVTAQPDAEYTCVVDMCAQPAAAAWLAVANVLIQITDGGNNPVFNNAFPMAPGFQTEVQNGIEVTTNLIYANAPAGLVNVTRYTLTIKFPVSNNYEIRVRNSYAVDINDNIGLMTRFGGTISSNRGAINLAEKLRVVELSPKLPWLMSGYIAILEDVLTGVGRQEYLRGYLRTMDGDTAAAVGDVELTVEKARKVQTLLAVPASWPGLQRPQEFLEKLYYDVIALKALVQVTDLSHN